MVWLRMNPATRRDAWGGMAICFLSLWAVAEVSDLDSVADARVVSCVAAG